MLLVGTPPFKGKSASKKLSETSVGYISFTNPIWRKISKEAQDFVKKLSLRQPSVVNLINLSLNDPWITKFNKTPAIAKVPLPIDSLNNLKRESL